MKKVMYIGNIKYHSCYKGEIYDVINYKPISREKYCDIIVLKVGGVVYSCYFYNGMDTNDPLFKDVTHEYRSETIDEILK